MLTIILLFKILSPYSDNAKKCYTTLLGLLKKILVFQKLFAAIAFCFLPFTIESQPLHNDYHIFRQKEIIGSLSATKKILNEGFSITIDSRTSISILFDINVNVYQFNKYQNGKLTEAIFMQSLNGRRKVHNTIQWGLNSYAAEMDGRKLRLDNEINYSVASLFFDEPVSIQKVFSENQLTVLSLRRVAIHSYVLQLPDGRINQYNYHDGVLVHAKLNTKFTSVELVLKEGK